MNVAGGGVAAAAVGSRGSGRPQEGCGTREFPLSALTDRDPGGILGEAPGGVDGSGGGGGGGGLCWCRGSPRHFGWLRRTQSRRCQPWPGMARCRFCRRSLYLSSKTLSQDSHHSSCSSLAWDCY